jgi:hypothetical protein
LLYKALNGPTDAKDFWDLFQHTKEPLLMLSKTLEGFKLLYAALNSLTDTNLSWESPKDRKISL